MGKINVDSIKTKLLREAAQRADKNGDKSLDEAEISIFEKDIEDNKILKKLNTMSQKEEYDNIINSVQKDNSYQDVIETGEKEYVYDQAGAAPAASGNPVFDTAVGRGYTSLVELYKALGSEEFKKDNAPIATKSLKDVINSFNSATSYLGASHTSFADIDKTFKQIEKNLPKDEEHERALEIVKDVAVRERQTYIRSELAKDYNPEEIVNRGGNLKKEAKKVEKKYKDNPDFKDEFENYRQEQDRAFSIKQADAIINNSEGTKATKVDRNAYREIKKTRKATGNKDLQVYYENSDDVRTKLRQQAIDNNVAEKRIQSEEDVLRQLSYVGSNTNKNSLNHLSYEGNPEGGYAYVLTPEKKELLSRLEDEGYIKRMEDGMLDLSGLSTLIRGQVGADNTLSKTRKDFKPVSEINGLKSEVSVQTNVQIDEKTAKELAKLCGYKVETLNWDNFVKNLAALGITVLATAAAAGAAGIAVGALAGAAISAPQGVRKGDNIYSHLEVNINDIANMYSDLAPENVAKLTPEQLAQKLDEIFSINSSAAKKELVDGALRVTIDTEILAPDEIILATKNLGPTILGAALGGAIAALPILFTAIEVPVAAADVNTDCLDDYVKHVYAQCDDKQIALMLSTLALECTDENGKLDAQLLRDKMQAIKGGNSLLNKRELQEYFRKKDDPKFQKEFNATVEQFRADRAKECPQPEEVEEPTEEEVVTEEPAVGEVIATATEKEVKEVEKFNARLSDWDTLISLYPCFKNDEVISKMSRRDQIRLLKLAQAITDGNYSRERMLELYEIRDLKKNADDLKKLDYFDYKVYENQVNATYFTDEANMVLPKEFAGCERDDIEIKDNDGGRAFLKTNKTYTESNKANEGSTKVEVTKETYWVKYLDENGNPKEESFDDILRREHRVEEIKAQKLGTKIQKVTITVRDWEDVEDFKNDDLK